MNWPKITGYVALTSISISMVAHIASRIIPEYHLPAQMDDLIRWSGYLWAYAAVAMGIFLMNRTGRLTEVVWGGLASLLCLVLKFGMFFAILYFFRAYAKLDRMDTGLPS